MEGIKCLCEFVLNLPDIYEEKIKKTNKAKKNNFEETSKWKKKQRLCERETTDSKAVVEDLCLENVTKDDEQSFSEFDSIELHDTSCVKVDSFVLVQCSAKKTRHYFVDKVLEIHVGNAFKGRFLVRRLTKVKSDFPEEDDIDEVNSDDIIDVTMKSPAPMATGGTKRTGKQVMLSLDLETFFKFATME